MKQIYFRVCHCDSRRRPRPTRKIVVTQFSLLRLGTNSPAPIATGLTSSLYCLFDYCGHLSEYEHWVVYDQAVAKSRDFGYWSAPTSGARFAATQQL